MRFDVITLFPAMFTALTEHGITRRARDLGLWSLAAWNPRDFTTDPHRTVDDRPFGGGPGMVMLAEPLARSVDAIRQAGGGDRVITLSTNGAPLTDAKVRAIAGSGGSLTLVCGRYEGIDHRFIEHYVDETISVGDFVLSGGEVAAMALIDAVVRQLPGALKETSTADESFIDGLLDGPHYTRPEQWQGRDVPAVLLSGNHADIKAWRRQAALQTTAKLRPDLLERARAEGRLRTSDERALRELVQVGVVAKMAVT